jgi:hypothetical protein
MIIPLNELTSAQSPASERNVSPYRKKMKPLLIGECIKERVEGEVR